MKNLTRIFLLPLSCIAVFGCASLGALAQVAISRPPVPTKSMLPSAHGIPDTIAGYRILSVRTSETTRCIQPGIADVTILVEAPTIDEALATTDWRAVLRELERLRPEVEWQIGIAGPVADMEAGIAGNERWNAVFADQPCLQFGDLSFLHEETPIAVIPAATEVAE